MVTMVTMVTVVTMVTMVDTLNQESIRMGARVTFVPRPLALRFYLAAMEKNQEKAWDQYYVTDRKWWTRLVH